MIHYFLGNCAINVALILGPMVFVVRNPFFILVVFSVFLIRIGVRVVWVALGERHLISIFINIHWGTGQIVGGIIFSFSVWWHCGGWVPLIRGRSNCGGVGSLDFLFWNLNWRKRVSKDYFISGIFLMFGYLGLFKYIIHYVLDINYWDILGEWTVFGLGGGQKKQTSKY